MGKILKSTISLLIILLSIACSNSSTSNNNQNTKEEASNIENVNAASKNSSGSECNRPLSVRISSADFVSKGNYILTYAWAPADNATSYEFEFTINGTTAFQNLAVTDTFITFPQAITATDSISAKVKTVCGSQKSATSKESSKAVYLNTIATDEIIYFVEPTTTITDICAKNCDKLKFNSLDFLNSDGTTITLNNFSMQVYFYDFQAVKNCIPCGTSGPPPVANPANFNSCLEDPLMEYWIFDPGAYQTCP